MKEATPKTIDKAAIEVMAAKAEMTASEFMELALYWMLDMFKDDQFAAEDAKQNLPHMRETYGELSPDLFAEKTELNPFMHRLFSGDLKFIHGPNFGIRNEFIPEQEHHGLAESIERILSDEFFNNTLPDLRVLEAMIHHNPNLRNEAEAIKTLSEAAQLLSEFTDAINAA